MKALMWKIVLHDFLNAGRILDDLVVSRRAVISLCSLHVTVLTLSDLSFGIANGKRLDVPPFRPMHAA